MINKILKFEASWCKPCEVLSQQLKNSKYKKLIERINVDEKRNISVKYNIKSLPTLIFLDENEDIIFRSSGVMTAKEFENLIENVVLQR